MEQTRMKKFKLPKLFKKKAPETERHQWFTMSEARSAESNGGRQGIRTPDLLGVSESL